MGNLTHPGQLFSHLQSNVSRHNSEHGAPTAVVSQTSNMICPDCNTDDAVLLVKGGRDGIICTKNPGHRWQDLGELRARNPRTIKAAPKVNPRATDGVVQLSILVHHTLKQQLESRFGNKLDVTLSALCGSLLDADAYVVPGPIASEISEAAGRAVKHAAALLGTLKEAIKAAADWKEQAEQATKGGVGTQNMQLAPGQVVVTLGPIMKDLKTKAESQGLSLEEMLANVIYQGFQNQWF